MLSMDDLQKTLQRIDGKGYKAYKDIKGVYSFPFFTMHLDYIQGDPFASPSRLRVRIPQQVAGIPHHLFKDRARRTGVEDYLTRRFAEEISKQLGGKSGSGKSGLVYIDRGGQEILERTSMVVNEKYVEARLSVGLPARGRTIMGKEAAELLCRFLPEVVRKSLLAESIDWDALKRHAAVNEDQEVLRSLLKKKGLVAFVADGALLPRKSGVSDEPMSYGEAVLFQSPPQLSTELHLPHRGKVRGMGIPTGITLIVGGGYHGKSTLLRALERGVYNHIPGDGREYTVSLKDAIKIRAEDGRRICKVNISPFINNLPMGKDTAAFTTDEASGSTSQAANIVEALEIGSSLLLLDEDTSATNFMIRDVRMQKLVAKEKEPITPFLDKVSEIYKELGVSTVIVMGGAGDYFDVADTVLMMDEYRAYDVTVEAKKVASDLPQGRVSEGGESFGPLTPRVILKKGLEPYKGKKKKIAARGLYTLQYGNKNLSLFYLEQLVDPSQTRFLGDLMDYVSRKYVDGKNSLKKAIELAYRDIEDNGLEVVSPFYGEHPGEYALPRKQEVAGAFNRLRSLVVK